MMLSEHFSLLELVQSDIAARYGIDNNPTTAIIARLKKLAALLEHVRTLLNEPLSVSSGYRCPALNSLVKGASNSAHLLGAAADFTASAFGSPLVVSKAILASAIPFDQLIYEYGRWVHLSIPATGSPARRMVMTKYLNQPYRLGLLTFA